MRIFYYTRLNLIIETSALHVIFIGKVTEFLLTGGSELVPHREPQSRLSIGNGIFV